MLLFPPPIGRSATSWHPRSKRASPFEKPGLEPEGSFKAAEVRYTSADQVDPKALRKWLEKSKKIQWDYKNIVKPKGKLVRLP